MVGSRLLGSEVGAMTCGVGVPTTAWASGVRYISGWVLLEMRAAGRAVETTNGAATGTEDWIGPSILMDDLCVGVSAGA